SLVDSIDSLLIGPLQESTESLVDSVDSVLISRLSRDL
ncbi:uncharacterized protein CTRU02_210376, partial [Colletotrichum truncatum]